VVELLQAGCASCHPTNSFIAMKDDGVPDWGQQAAKIIFAVILQTINTAQTMSISVEGNSTSTGEADRSYGHGVFRMSNKTT